MRRHVPGNMARDDRWWDRLLRDEPDERHGATARRHLLHTEADGTVTGYATYRMKASWTDTSEPDGTLTVGEVRATTPAAYAALWQFLLSIDLVRTVKRADGLGRRPAAPPAAPTPARCTPGRSTRCGCGWSTSAAALSARRYPAPIDLVFEVRDDVLPVEHRALAPVGPPRRRLLRPHRPRPRHRARHRGALGGLPRRRLAGAPCRRPGGSPRSAPAR